MEKRVLAAILLSLGILFVYQEYFTPQTPSPTATTTSAQTAGSAHPSATSEQAAPSAAATAPAPAVPAAPAAAPLIADSSAHDIDVDTDYVHAVFSTQGAVLKSWRLKRYFAISNKGVTTTDPLDLVPAELPETADVGGKTVTLDRPFTLETDDPSMSATLAHALYRPSVSSLSLGRAPGTLSFEYRDASGLGARKTFHFQPDGKPYQLSVDLAVDVAGAAKPAIVDWGPGLGNGYQPDGSRETQPAAGILWHNGKVDRLSAKTLTSQPTYTDTFLYAGVTDHYFLSAILPGTRPVRVDFQPLTLPIPIDLDPRGGTRTFVDYRVHVPDSASVSFFVGPKDFDLLHAVDPELVRAIDFGMFSWLVVPLLQALKWTNSYVHNYGWSIVVLTVLMNLAIFPLRHRSMVSMRKMQGLQPEIKAIQDRYAKYKITDPERQKANQEVMALYKSKGASPTSGCLPMLLTFPLLFAFYALLGSAIELRGAPFIFWIHDLSLRDPYYILPIVMGVSMFWQQRMMPQPGIDPAQRWIFAAMPLIFLFTFLWYPSGMAVYWFTSNLMAIGQQYLTNRMIGAPAPAPARVAAVRRNNAAGKS